MSSFAITQARWSKLDSDLFNDEKASFDFSKLPDIYDCIKYDVLHNLTSWRDLGIDLDRVSWPLFV